MSKIFENNREYFHDLADLITFRKRIAGHAESACKMNISAALGNAVREFLSETDFVDSPA